MPGSLRLGKLFGIDVYVHISWFIILVLLTSSLAIGWFARSFPGWSVATYWTTAAISSLLLFAGVLVHELAHSLVARYYRMRVKHITLFVFGGVATIEDEMKRPGVEFQVAIAGPIASFLFAGLAFALALPFRGTNSPTEAVLDYLAIANLLLGVLNMIPGFPLDGGRVLRSIIWKVTGNFQRSTRIASYVGQGCAYLFILIGIVEFFAGNFFNGLWTVFIGWFLLTSAQAANTQVAMQSALEGVTVGQAMNTQPVAVPANISVQRLVDEYFLPRALSSALVVQGDHLMGLVTLNEIRQVAREQWPSSLVGHILKPAEQLYTATPEQSLHEVLDNMISRNVRQVPVLEGGRLVGQVSRETIINHLQVRQSLQTAPPQRERESQYAG